MKKKISGICLFAFMAIGATLSCSYSKAESLTEEEQKIVGTWHWNDTIDTVEGPYYFAKDYDFDDAHKVVRTGKISYTAKDAEKGWIFTGVVPYTSKGEWHIEGDSLRITYDGVEFSEMQYTASPEATPEDAETEQYLIAAQFAGLIDAMRELAREPFSVKAVVSKDGRMTLSDENVGTQELIKTNL